MTVNTIDSKQWRSRLQRSGKRRVNGAEPMADCVLPPFVDGVVTKLHGAIWFKSECICVEWVPVLHLFVFTSLMWRTIKSHLRKMLKLAKFHVNPSLERLDFLTQVFVVPKKTNILTIKFSVFIICNRFMNLLRRSFHTTSRETSRHNTGLLVPTARPHAPARPSVCTC